MTIGGFYPWFILINHGLAKSGVDIMGKSVSVCISDNYFMILFFQNYS